MKILAINAGSSSIKYGLYEIDDDSYNVLAKGLIEKIGEEQSFIHHEINAAKIPLIERKINDPKEAIDSIEGILVGSDKSIGIKNKVIDDMVEIEGFGHRIVHGGRYTKSAIIDNMVKQTTEKLYLLAPLHNPPNLAGIIACEHYNKPQVGVFDTAPYHGMPEVAYQYSIDRDFWEDSDGFKIRRYGFHGTSHRYIWERISDIIGKDKKIISVHLGNGCSVTAIDKGIFIDTSMGLTPLGGIMMGTRGGDDIDPGLVLYLMEKHKWNVEQAREFFTKKCGLKGMSHMSNDVREVYAAADNGDYRAQEAINKYAYTVRKCIGANMAALGGADAIAFTAGVGANSPRMRAQILEGLGSFGIALDYRRNQQECVEKPILISNGEVGIYALQTNEEIVIAQDTYRLIRETVNR